MSEINKVNSDTIEIKLIQIQLKEKLMFQSLSDDIIS
jgi:hypothetical protein